MASDATPLIPEAVNRGIVESPALAAVDGSGASAAAADNGSLQYSVHTGTGTSAVLIFPHGTVVENPRIKGQKKAQKPCQDVKRGLITTMSDKSAARMRRFCCENWIPGHTLISYTLTTKALLTPEQFRRAKKRFFVRRERASDAFVWRVEVQKRGAAHLHILRWVKGKIYTKNGGRQVGAILYDDGRAVDAFEDDWLQCVGEENDRDSREHAVFAKVVEDEGAIVYQCAHAGKQKAEQLGWQGKQWGIIGKSRYHRRTPEVHELTQIEVQRYGNYLNALLTLKREQRMIRRNDELRWRGEEPQTLYFSRSPRVVTYQRCIGESESRRLLRRATRGRSGTTSGLSRPE